MIEIGVVLASLVCLGIGIYALFAPLEHAIRGEREARQEIMSGYVANRRTDVRNP